jgi:hypothetical protein
VVIPRAEVIEASLSIKVFIVAGINIAPSMIPGKLHKICAARFRRNGKTSKAAEFSIRLVKRPQALEYARVYIGRANRRSVFKRKLVSSTQVIEQSDAADKPDTVLDTKEGRIHNGWPWYEIVRRIVVGRRRHDNNARRPTALILRNALIRISLSRIVSAVGAGNAWRLP